MIWAILFGYASGSLPTAELVGRLRGVDLRSSGSGNPGAANALRVGGRGMAAVVLALDLGKGAAAAIVGAAIDGDATAIAAAAAAVLAQVHNPWFGFRGGKGLGVTAGTALVVWPAGLLVTLPVLGAAAKGLRSAAGALVALAWFFAASLLWASNGWATPWGIVADDTLVWYAIAVVVLTAPKFAAGIGRHRPAPPPSGTLG